jgi:cytochrome c peroxidase
MACVLHTQQLVLAYRLMGGRQSILAAVVVVLVPACADELVDEFTPLEWEYLQTFRLGELPPACPPHRTEDCDDLARFGQRIFFDTRYAGPISMAGADDGRNGGLGPEGADGLVSCASCHDPAHAFRDARSNPNGTSVGTDWTKRNSPSLLNLSLYENRFTWIGEYDDLAAVFALPLGSPAALNSTGVTLQQLIGTVEYAADYNQLFEPNVEAANAAEVVSNVGIALAAYQYRLVSVDSPVDRYLDGDRDALSASAKRGLRLFIGEAMCSECHGGPMLTDWQYRNTGVPQIGLHVPAIDRGRAIMTCGTAQICDDDGKFRTPTLRNVARTAPYMHTGHLETLVDVVEFYRWGGVPAGFVGTPSELIMPLEIDDAGVADLVALLEAFDGAPVDPALLAEPW